MERNDEARNDSPPPASSGTRSYRGLWRHRDSSELRRAHIPKTGGITACRQWGNRRRKTRGNSPWGLWEALRWCCCRWCRETRGGRPPSRGVRSWGKRRPGGHLCLRRCSSVRKHQAHESHESNPVRTLFFLLMPYFGREVTSLGRAERLCSHRQTDSTAGFCGNTRFRPCNRTGGQRGRLHTTPGTKSLSEPAA